MGKCEDAIVEKGKDVAYLKYNLNEVKKSFNEKEEEVDLLKNKNSKIAEELKLVMEKTQDLKHQFDIKMENLMLKNQLLEKNVNSIEIQLLVSKKQLQDQQVEITSVKQEVEDVKSNLSEDIKFHLSKPLNDFQSSTNNDVKKLKDEVNKVNNQIRASRSYLDKSLNKTNNEINKLAVQVTTVDKKMKDNFITLNDKIDKDDVDVRCNLNENVKYYVNKSLNDFQSSTNNDVKKLKDEVNNTNNQIEEIRSYLDKNTDEFNNLSTKIDATENVIKDNFSTLNDKINNEAEGVNLENDPQKEIANLKHTVNNIENILFCDTSAGCKDVLLQWKLQNYQYYFDIGEPVWSPIFLTQIKGYCFKLVVVWTEENEILALVLKVCRGSNYDKPVEPFKMSFSLEMVDNKGNISSRKTSLSDIETNREAFTLVPGSNECAGLGGYFLLHMSDVNNYILNDMLSIQCRLTPS